MFIYTIALGDGGCNYIVYHNAGEIRVWFNLFHFYFVTLRVPSALTFTANLFFFLFFVFFSLLCELQQFVFDASLLLLLLKLLTFLTSRSIGYYIVLNELTFHIDLCTSRSMTRLLLHMR
jgi:hypothetical protein